jgi:hypothetical protein
MQIYTFFYERMKITQVLFLILQRLFKNEQVF